MESGARWEPLVCVYCPLKAGSIDGTDTRPHDRAVERAIKAIYKPNKKVQGDPECTLFIGRLDTMTSQDQLNKIFSKYGDIVRLRLVRDIVTGMSKQYAFIEYSKHRYAMRARIEANHMALDGRDLLVDWECERTLSKWIPRRLGGGFGGRKESGQLRFGGTDRPHRKPIIVSQQHHSRGEVLDKGNERWRERNPDRYRDDRSTGYRAMSRHDRRKGDDRDGGSYYDRHRGGHEERSTHRDRDRNRGEHEGRSTHRDRGEHGERSPHRHRDGDRDKGEHGERSPHRDRGEHGERSPHRHRDGDRDRGEHGERSAHTDRDKDRHKERSRSNNEQSTVAGGNDVSNSNIKTESECVVNMPRLLNTRNTLDPDIKIKQEKD
ncbi:U11/U12 small nuclear ribonucleoprotein 35 kDa protein-like [Asterias rubens]|uniref:U11/U12 small nuclear ribonucleoprotein 35 kDa protein-like n=1 Tax=Asterias rubens TaxID=7604 RepID=UPI0014552A26|nr:U11/U12 small nuclear ribonucleoprotein 35 kDa protein-like [Asterias rubens]